MYLKELAKKWDELQLMYGDKEFNSIYGYGETDQPELMLVFMNPTARNIGSHRDWQGIRAPWVGTKAVWKMLDDLNLFTNKKLLREIDERDGAEWDPNLAERVYQNIQSNSVYITNIAKCTLSDARAVKNSIYKEYLPTMLQEIAYTKPKNIITFGNQVSSIIIGNNTSVSNYQENEFESLEIAGEYFRVFPTYYPVGQGRRNMPKAKKRILSVLEAI